MVGSVYLRRHQLSLISLGEGIDDCTEGANELVAEQSRVELGRFGTSHEAAIDPFVGEVIEQEVARILIVIGEFALAAAIEGLQWCLQNRREDGVGLIRKVLQQGTSFR